MKFERKSGTLPAISRFARWAAAAGCLLAFAPPASASQEMQDKMRQLAERILATTKQQAVTVGVFSGSADLSQVNSGPGFEGVLTDQLNRLAEGIVRKEAKYEVKGDFAFAKVRDPALEGLKVVKVTARIIEKEFNEEQDRVPFEVVLDNTKSIAEALQLTGTLSDRSPDGGQVPKQKRNEEIADQVANPSVHIDGTQVSSSSTSPYAVEVFVKPHKDHESHKADARSCKESEGQAFVDIKTEELYEVRIHNKSKADVAVALTIDGLDVFHFSKDRVTKADAEAAAAPFKGKADFQQVLDEKLKRVGQSKYAHYIVHPKGFKDDDGSVYDGTLTVVGWHNSLEGKENYLSFLVTDYGKGAVSKEGITARGKVGVIHASFAKCRPLAPGSRAAAGNETGFGPPRTVKQKAVNYEIDPPNEFVAIRYARQQE